MSRFVDQYLPTCVAGYPCVSSPRWSTRIVEVDSGAERAATRWENPKHRFTLPEAVRDWSIVEAVRNHWMVMRGPYHIWPWKDPLDFASVSLTQPNVAPSISAMDVNLGTSDGTQSQFQLYRDYTVGSQTLRRKIELPVVSTLLVGKQGGTSGYVLPTWTVSRPGGVLTFDSPVASGVTVFAGFLYDVPVRFEDDASFDGILHTLRLGGYADLTFIETRIC